ncbi:MAG TPA: dephospho-CoA kinase, partial [Candidatus Obscuribacter sp.]|nr:dephospho-CoA kinase [Candidatus Obscuribacter sp.]
CQGEPLPPVDRKALGALVFSDPQKRRNLEAILHPNVILNCRKRVKDLSESGSSSRFPLVAILVPLLFEAKLEKEYDEIWSVFTEESVLRQRLGERDKLSQAEIENRLAAQLPQSEKARRAGQVIDNSGTPDETERQVNLLLEKMFPAGKPQTLS